MYPHPNPPPLAGEGVFRSRARSTSSRLFEEITGRAPLTPSPAGGGGLGWGHAVNKVLNV